MRVKIYIIALLFCYGCISLSAQNPAQNQLSGGQGNIGTNYGIQNNYFTNTKELTEIKKGQEQIMAKQDSQNLQLNRIEQRMAITDSIYRNDIAKRDSINQVLIKERELLVNEHRVMNDSIIAINQRRVELESIIEIQKKGNLLPFGIKQINNNPKGLGYTFAVSQVAVPAIWFGGFYCKALNSYDKYENRIALTLEEHNKYFNDYKTNRCVAIWGAVGTGVIVYAVNVLCNYYCTKIEINPQTFTDLQGNLGVGVSIGFKL